MLFAKYRKDWRWYLAEGLVSPLYLGRYFMYPAGNASRLSGKTKAAYLAYTIGWNAIVKGGVWRVCMDEEEEDEEEVEEGDWGGGWLCGGEEGGDLLNKFKGVLRTNFWTCEWIPSFVSKSGFGYTERVSSGCSEVKAPGHSEVEGNE